MPELPEVEVLVRHLRPLLRNRAIRSVTVSRPKTIRPNTIIQMRRALVGCSFTTVHRRGKYLVFTLRHPLRRKPVQVLGHLGMTGRIYLQLHSDTMPRHTAVALDLGAHVLVFEDTRYFGRFTLDLTPLNQLGPEPLSAGFNPIHLAAALRQSAQPIKVKLLDQTMVAGIGNIYASEALFHARIDPTLPARELAPPQIKALHVAIRHILSHAVRWGSTVPLDWAGTGPRDGLFYYGRPRKTATYYEERLQVYDRVNQPCPRCRTPIQRLTQANRSTYYCPACQT
jgi:formamidopyrimidine-DNA glycosylase